MLHRQRCRRVIVPLGRETSSMTWILNQNRRTVVKAPKQSCSRAQGFHWICTRPSHVLSGSPPYQASAGRPLNCLIVCVNLLGTAPPAPSLSSLKFPISQSSHPCVIRYYDVNIHDRRKGQMCREALYIRLRKSPNCAHGPAGASIAASVVPKRDCSSAWVVL